MKTNCKNCVHNIFSTVEDKQMCIQNHMGYPHIKHCDGFYEKTAISEAFGRKGRQLALVDQRSNNNQRNNGYFTPTKPMAIQEEGGIGVFWE